MSRLAAHGLQGGYERCDRYELEGIRKEVTSRCRGRQQSENFGEIQKYYVAPTLAATDMNVWVQSLYSLHDVPLAERLRLRRDADAESAERGGAELLGEDVAAGAPSSAPSSPAVKRAKKVRHKQ